MMLSDAPAGRSSSAVSREGAVADIIRMLSLPPVLQGQPPEPVEFSWQVLELDSTFPETLRRDLVPCGADFPSEHALQIGRVLCADLDRILPRVVSFTDLEAFEGDLLIHWRSETRSVTLICPADSTRKAKLYREEHDGNHTLKSDISPDPRASDVAREIQWVWNPD
jgi:hypothetical protein